MVSSLETRNRSLAQEWLTFNMLEKLQLPGYQVSKVSKITKLSRSSVQLTLSLTSHRYLFSAKIASFCLCYGEGEKKIVAGVSRNSEWLFVMRGPVCRDSVMNWFKLKNNYFASSGHKLSRERRAGPWLNENMIGNLDRICQFLPHANQ